MTVNVVQCSNQIQIPFVHIGRYWCARFQMSRQRVFGQYLDDDRIFSEVTEWCRERWGRPIRAEDSGDIPVQRWAVYNFTGPSCYLYFSTPEQAMEFKMRWC